MADYVRIGVVVWRDESEREIIWDAPTDDGRRRICELEAWIVSRVPFPAGDDALNDAVGGGGGGQGAQGGDRLDSRHDCSVSLFVWLMSCDAVEFFG